MESIELVAQAGFDFVVIDLEHSAMSSETAYRQIGVASLSGVAPIVRVPGLEGGLVGRLLDAGAEGIMVPHVDTVADADAAVRMMRFPPLGTRGVGPTGRAGGWGALPRAEYVRFAQEEVVLIAQLESATAVENASAIAARPGVDALLVGVADLSMSELREESDPAITSLVAQAVRDARATGKPIGNSGAASASAVRYAAEAGFSFTLMSNDASLLGAAASAAVAAGRSVTRDQRQRLDDRDLTREHA